LKYVILKPPFKSSKFSVYCA